MLEKFQAGKIRFSFVSLRKNTKIPPLVEKNTNFAYFNILSIYYKNIMFFKQLN